MTANAQLYVTLEIGNGAATGALAVLDAALASTVIASVLISPLAGQSLDVTAAKALIERSQKKGVAAFIADDANLAQMLKADGVHISWSKDPVSAYRNARAITGERMMIGVDAGRSRHDAMLLGEAGADYVAFGIPPHVEDRATAQERQCDLVAWWSKIFEVPCVAFDVISAEQARQLSLDGADFIAVTVSSAMTPQQVATLVKDCAEAITLAGVSA